MSKDEVEFAGYDEKAREKAKGLIESFKQFIEDNKDEITALQIIYNQPYNKRHITYADIKELAKIMSVKPINISMVRLWNAYEQLEESRVKGHTSEKVLSNIISLLEGKGNKERNSRIIVHLRHFNFFDSIYRYISN